jgi:hypothetical protein
MPVNPLACPMDRIVATLSELEVWLQDRLRAQPFNPRLKAVKVHPSQAAECGWFAEVVGDFAVAEHAAAAMIVSDLQQSFCVDLATRTAASAADVKPTSRPAADAQTAGRLWLRGPVRKGTRLI